MKPLQSKTALEVANVLEKIFKERKQEKSEIDKGKELFFTTEKFRNLQPFIPRKTRKNRASQKGGTEP